MSDCDLVVRWAAEEFVAAGRASDAKTRQLHRRRAAFFADLVEGMRAVPPAYRARPARPPILGRILRRAFPAKRDDRR